MQWTHLRRSRDFHGILQVATRPCRPAQSPTVQRRLGFEIFQFLQLPTFRFAGFEKMASKMNGFVTQKTAAPGADIMNARRAEIGNSVRIKKGDTKKATKTANAQPVEMTPPATTEKKHAVKEDFSRQKYTSGTNTDAVTKMIGVKVPKDSQIGPLANEFIEAASSSEFAGHDENRGNGHYYEGEMTPGMIRTMNQFNDEGGGYDSYPPTTDGGIEQIEEGKDYSGSGSEDDDEDEGSAEQVTPKKLAPTSNPNPRADGLHQNMILRQTEPHRTSSMNVTVSESPPAQLSSRQHAQPFYQLPQRGGNNRLGGVRSNSPNCAESPTRRPKSRGNIQRHQGNPQRAVQFPNPPLQHHGHRPIQMANPPRQTHAIEPISLITHPPQTHTKQTKSKTRTSSHPKQQQASPVQEEIEQSLEQLPNNRDALDYTPEQLADMPYTNLQEESFDLDPGAQPLQFEAQLKSTLQESLVSVRRLHTEEQQRFFASLPLGQWEDAGDWFLDQFSEVLNKIRDARKKRRQVAASLEGEVYSRYQEVETRKKKLDEVMAEMKATGVVVLKSQSNLLSKRKREE
jgi:hypothetical protein